MPGRGVWLRILGVVDSVLEGLLEEPDGSVAAHIERAEQVVNLLTAYPELTNPDQRGLARERLQLAQRWLEGRFAEALAVGQLADVDPSAFARFVLAGLSGTALLWAVRGDGTLAERVEETIAGALAPYRRAPGTRGGRTP